MKYVFSFLLLSISALALPACQNAKDVMANAGMPVSGAIPQSATSPEALIKSECPQTDIVDELGAMIEFANPSSPAANAMISRLDMVKISSACSFKAKTMTVDLKLDFKGMLGPEGKQANGDRPFFSYPFFVAVTSPGGAILAKEVFAASVNYEPGQSQINYTENLRHIIPVTSKEQGGQHRILVGFQLSPEQLEYNRKLLKTR